MPWAARWIEDGRGAASTLSGAYTSLSLRCAAGALPMAWGPSTLGLDALALRCFSDDSLHFSHPLFQVPVQMLKQHLVQLLPNALRVLCQRVGTAFGLDAGQALGWESEQPSGLESSPTSEASLETERGNWLPLVTTGTLAVHIDVSYSPVRPMIAVMRMSPDRVGVGDVGASRHTR